MLRPYQSEQTTGWHSRGYLPHFDGGEILQFVTVHLGDAMPQTVLAGWKAELERAESDETNLILHRRREAYLDQNYGACQLKNERVAAMVQNALLFLDGSRCQLISWTIMPNHAHFLIKPLPGHRLSDIIHSFKSFTAHEANKMLAQTGKFWQADYFDRYIRNYEHYEKTVTYIENNPVKAGLCEKPSDWKFGSAACKKEVS